MARINRYFIIIPISLCALLIIAQFIIHRKSTLHKWSGWSRSLPGYRQKMDTKRQGSSTSRALSETMRFAGDWYSNEVADDIDKMYGEELERLRTSPYIYDEDEELERLTAPIEQKEMKYISYYKPWDNTQKSFKVCRYNMCSYAKKMEDADVIAFKASLIRDQGVPSFHRPKHQRWVMFTSDPASKNYDLDNPEIKSSFNATCTYRLNSDIPWTFGRLRKVQAPKYNYDKIYDGKEKSVAWFVSHCNTFGRREIYVERMQRAINVDIFGLCSNLSCGNFNHRKDDTTSCLPMLSNKYKFYLSFENAFCEDYVTEKFFKLFKQVHVIPVVRGGVKYNQLFPNGVYIDAADFQTPEDLAHYLRDLGNDKERYIQMLKRKSSWIYTPGGEMKHCMMCEYAHTQQATKHIPDLKEIFNGEFPHCWRPLDV